MSIATRKNQDCRCVSCEHLESRTMLDGVVFNDPLPGPIAASSRGTVTADFDLDGKIDVALSVGRELRFLKGNGDGTFAAPVALTLDADIGTIAVGRMDGDARPDIASAIPLSGGRLLTRLLIFDPTLGQFKVSARLVTQNAFEPRRNLAFVGVAVQAGNLLGGWRDELLVQASDGNVRVIRVINRTTLAEALTEESTPIDLQSARLADLDSNGLDEIYYSDSSGLRGRSISTFGRTNRFFDLPVLYRSLSIGSFAIADMTGDGKLDILLRQENGFTDQRRPLALLEGDGFGRIARLRDWAPTSAANLNFSIIHAIQDLNNDGRLDVVGQSNFVESTRSGTSGSTTLVILLDDGAGGWTQTLAATFGFRSDVPIFRDRASLAALTGSGPDLLDLIAYSHTFPSTLSIRTNAGGPVGPRLTGGGPIRLNNSPTEATGFYASITTSTAHADLGGSLRSVEVIWDRNNNGLIDDGEETIGAADSARASQNVLRVASLLPDDARSVPVFRLLARGVGIDGQLSNIIDLGSVTWSP